MAERRGGGAHESWGARRRGVAALVVAALGVALAAGTATGATARSESAAALRLVEVASGLELPVHVAQPPGEPGRLYVVEQAGRIRVVESGSVRARPFLDITGAVGSGGERGLLSMAFHPGYASNGRFYVNYTNRNGDTEVRELRAANGRARAGRGKLLLRVGQPYANHNGGQLQFGPDGLLYVGMGDGGSGGDPENRAQNLGSRLGKLLTVNVDTGRVRIVAYGLRNPWRFSFDRANGDLWVADVGQGSFEEVSRVASGWRPLIDFGWDVFEGNASYEDKPRNTAGRLIRPVVTYGRRLGYSITGGYVYRGRRLAADQVGRYFYGDYGSGNVWSVRVSGGKAGTPRRLPFTVPGLTSFGEDLAGELYLVAHGGTVYRLAG
jgi:glucose/arabinose dehydrogenase